ncbi:hypothetical protein MSAN_02028500 [Mycena sanguinolenta]|uniref:CxC6 like cysteine cluster associated with KDZ domain-containing protein n=1 Tax=Mycena sanguinolenta TaxID=230812 RepID=A0A8H6XLJ1_9AGAR|nr:hypothetical protein MSAN_02028500 [Mycena sanguinolenta]
MSEADQIPYTQRSITKKLKAELQAIASALGLEAEQTVPELRNDIQKHIRAHPELADNPRFTPLFAHRPEVKVAGKNSADKAGEEASEMSGSGGTITGANRILHQQQVKTDPPAQFSRLTLNDAKRVAQSEVFDDDNDSDFDSGSVGSRSGTPSPVPEERKEKPKVKKQTTVEVARASLPEVVRVNFFDANDPMAEPRQVPVLSKEIPISAFTTENGSTQYTTKLSQLLPVAFQTTLRSKGQNHIGKIDTILQGDCHPLQIGEVNTYTLRTAASGDLFCDLFLDVGAPVANSLNCASSNMLLPPAVNMPNIEHGPIYPLPAEQRLKFTGAGTDVPLAIATDRAKHNPTGKIAAPGVREHFLRFLHSELAAHITDLPAFGATWPRAKYAGALLERQLIEEKVYDFFAAWSRPVGGYLVPQGYSDYAGTSFTKDEVLDAITTVHRFHAAWANFAEWVNDSTCSTRKFTYRQSQRLFVEHFARRLLLFHNKPNFSCEAHPSTRLLAEAVRATIGVNGGVLEAAMSHGCMDCTHLKRYRADLIAQGVEFGGDQDVAEMDDNTQPTENNGGNLDGVFAPPPQQDAPLPGGPRGYVRMVVMDGKTIPHEKCALDECERPLVNYKNGRFCEVHLNLQEKCGIIPCGLPVRQVGALTCTTESHIEWERQYSARFFRLTFPGVRRVIRQQQGLADNETAHGHGPTLRVSLPALGDTPGDQVVHTFKAKYTYCLQTVQLACGYPVGWGKCYRSESPRQVMAILNRILENHPNSRPSFIAYDDACDLLRHIITQNRNDPWITSTKFIVDAWHYIGHRATDMLCRVWCNPAPKNGSQPDLVVVEQDANGVQHQTRAFNTETAEQLNSWLNGFETQLRHMSDVNYDFFVHVLMMIFAERVDKKVIQRQRELSDDFWVQATGE